MMNSVYYLEDEILNPIAIRPNIEQGMIRWDDTGRGVSLPLDTIQYEPANCDINTTAPKVITLVTRGQTLRLEFLTKEIFDAKLKNRVAAGRQLNFKNDSEVQNFYLSANFLI